jgi:hypothetical protein
MAASPPLVLVETQQERKPTMAMKALAEAEDNKRMRKALVRACLISTMHVAWDLLHGTHQICLPTI